MKNSQFKMDRSRAPLLSRSPVTRTVSLLALGCILLLTTIPARAGLSEPDNILYGTISLGGQLITSEYLDVVVQARRSINGPAVASYRMGDNPQLGNLYYLKIPTESGGPVTDTNASLSGDTLYIAVSDSTGLRTNQTYTLSGRGWVQRLDFGAAVPDADGNGLPDAWEQLYFGSAGQNPLAVRANGLTTLQNYIAGTATNEFFRVNMSLSSGQRIVSFQSHAATGVGYEGMSRIYALEYTTNLGATWLGVPSYTNVLGNSQTLFYTEPGTNPAKFYRGQVRLEKP